MNYLNVILDVQRLSQTGDRYILRNLMGSKYKGIHQLIEDPKLLKRFDNLQKYFHWGILGRSWIQKYMVDKFHADLSGTSEYNWSKRGVKAVLPKIIQTYSINFSIAIHESEILLI